MRCSHEVWDASTAASSCAGALLLNRLDDTQPIAPAASERASSRSIGTRRAECACATAGPRSEAIQPPTVREVRDSVGGRRRGDLATWCARRGSRVFSRHATPRARALSPSRPVSTLPFVCLPWLESRVRDLYSEATSGPPADCRLRRRGQRSDAPPKNKSQGFSCGAHAQLEMAWTLLGAESATGAPNRTRTTMGLPGNEMSLEGTAGGTATW